MANQGKRRDDEDGEHESNAVSGVAASRMYLFGWSRNLSTKSINCPYSNCPRLAGELLLIVTLRTVLLDRRLVVMN